MPCRACEVPARLWKPTSTCVRARARVCLTISDKTQYRVAYQPSQFTIHGGNGTAYVAGVTAGAQPLGRGELEPTKDATGVVNFVVPQEAKDFVLTYRIPNGNTSLSIRLGL